MKLNTNHNEIEEWIADIASGRAVRTFSILSQSWYAEAVLKSVPYYDEVGFRLTYYDDHGAEDGCLAECFFRWEELGSGDACKFHAFDDSWKMLPLFMDVIEGMSNLVLQPNDRKLIDHNGKKATPSVEMVVEMLTNLGLSNETKYEQ